MTCAISTISGVAHFRRRPGWPLALLLMFGFQQHSTAGNEAHSCLPGERGFLQASLRGALDVQLNWHGAPLQCEGGARPEGRGLRISFSGPLSANGRRLRIVFGVAAKPGVSLQHTLPTNLTVIVENENRIYATLGDDRCTVESLVQELLPESLANGKPNGAHDYRIAARGFCIAPAATLSGDERLYIDRFDFAGRAHFEEAELNEVPATS
jgi:hypothetical protein